MAEEVSLEGLLDGRLSFEFKDFYLDHPMNLGS